MDVRLSIEQQALRDTASSLTRRLCPTSVRSLSESERALKLDAAVDSAGWRELRAGDEEGAAVASGADVALVAEEMGRALADVPFFGPTMAAELRRLAGADPGGPGESLIMSPDLTTPAVLSPSGQAWSMHGVAIEAAGASRGLAIGPGGELLSVRLPAIASGSDPKRVGPDLTRPCWAVRGPWDEPIVVGRRPVDDSNLEAWTALGLAVGCADLVGVMRGALALAIDYAKTRQQYGTAVGSFQAIQHLLADAHVATEGSASVARHAAWSVDALSPADALAASSTAKAFCARAARQVCEAAIQVHGGIGNTWDCLAHVYLRRALLSTSLLGGIGVSLERALEHRVRSISGLR